MSNLDEGFVCEIFDDQYSHYCRHCGAAQEQGESPATVRPVGPANRQSTSASQIAYDIESHISNSAGGSLIMNFYLKKWVRQLRTL